jgi:hypothetical protein
MIILPSCSYENTKASDEFYDAQLTDVHDKAEVLISDSDLSCESTDQCKYFSFHSCGGGDIYSRLNIDEEELNSLKSVYNEIQLQKYNGNLPISSCAAILPHNLQCVENVCITEELELKLL